MTDSWVDERGSGADGGVADVQPVAVSNTIATAPIDSIRRAPMHPVYQTIRSVAIYRIVLSRAWR
ncbi:hypothetical protein [Microbacterium oxydans]|uniref:hypothetical protein n=1 Tax=Microbacterium oxydans TaxID=82380 RepID=UPI001E47071F|nr:hypothetical protein [Microbacterium oxydans]